MRKPTCSGCIYWLHIEGGDGLDDEGECHRMPPQILVNEVGGMTLPHVAAWPPTPGSEVCGEHPAFPAWIAAQANA